MTNINLEIPDIQAEAMIRYGYANNLRSIPDVRDGLKPVQRRALFTAFEDDIRVSNKFRKLAGLSGSVLSRYHPHGSNSVDDAIVRLSQDWVNIAPLFETHGNKGDVSGAPAAAARYLEVRASKSAEEFFKDLDEKNVVDWKYNYDNERLEPTVLPTRFPNLLVNGTSAMGYGYASDVVPHSLVNVINTLNHLIKFPDSSIEDLVKILKGPSFPTGGIIINGDDLLEIYKTGNGVVKVRSKIETINSNKVKKLIIREIPHLTNTERIITSIKDAVRSNLISGIKDINDLSSEEDGIAIEIELKSDAQPSVVENLLYVHTLVQNTLKFNFNCIVNCRIKLLNLKEYLEEFIKFRREVIFRRFSSKIKNHNYKIHIIEGLIKCFKFIDEVIAIIKQNENRQEIISILVKKYDLTTIQAEAIIEMKLIKLSKLGLKDLQDEILKHKNLCQNYMEIIKNPETIDKQILTENSELNLGKIHSKEMEIINIEKFSSKEIEKVSSPEEEIFLAISSQGMLKGIKASEYRAQRRGGKGKTIHFTDDDPLIEIMYCNTHQNFIAFSNSGIAYNIDIYKTLNKSIHVSSLVGKMDNDDYIVKILKVNPEDRFLLFLTSDGLIKRSSLEHYIFNRQNGLIAIKLEDNQLMDVTTCNESDFVMVYNTKKSNKYSVKEIGESLRISKGYSAMRLNEGEKVLGMEVVKENDTRNVFTISNDGFGKLTRLEEYSLVGRTTKGSTAMELKNKNSLLAGLKLVNLDDDIVVVTNQGMLIRIPVSNLNLQSRKTMGSKIINLSTNDFVLSIESVKVEEENIQ